MSLIKFFNGFSNLFEDRDPITEQAISALVAAGHMIFEKNLSPRQMAALSDCIGGGEVARTTLPNGRVVYYDRYASNTYQLASMVPASETFWNTAFMNRRDLNEIMASISPAPRAPLSTQQRFTVVSS